MDGRHHSTVISIIGSNPAWSRPVGDQQGPSSFMSHSLVIPSITIKSSHESRWKDEGGQLLLAHKFIPGSSGFGRAIPKYNQMNCDLYDQPLDLTCTKKRKMSPSIGPHEDIDFPLDLSMKKARMTVLQQEPINFAQFQGLDAKSSALADKESKSSFNSASSTSGNFDNPILVDDAPPADNPTVWSVPKFPASKLIQFAHFHNSAVTQLAPCHFPPTTNYSSLAPSNAANEHTLGNLHISLAGISPSSNLFGFFTEKPKAESNGSLLLQGASATHHERLFLDRDNCPQTKYLLPAVPTNVIQSKVLDTKLIKSHEMGSNLRKLLKNEEPAAVDVKFVDGNEFDCKSISSSSSSSSSFSSSSSSSSSFSFSSSSSSSSSSTQRNNKSNSSILIRNLQNIVSPNYGQSGTVPDEPKTTPIAPFSNRGIPEAKGFLCEPPLQLPRTSTLPFALGSEGNFPVETSSPRTSCKVLGHRSSKKIPVANVQPFMKAGLLEVNEPIVIDPSPPPPSLVTVATTNDILGTSDGHGLPNSPDTAPEQVEGIFTNAKMTQQPHWNHPTRTLDLLKFADQTRNDVAMTLQSPQNITTLEVVEDVHTDLPSSDTPTPLLPALMTGASMKVAPKEGRGKKTDNQSKKKPSCVSAIEYIDDDTVTQDGCLTQVSLSDGVKDGLQTPKQKRNYVRRALKSDLDLTSPSLPPSSSSLSSSSSSSSSSSGDIHKLATIPVVATSTSRRKYQRRKKGREDEEEEEEEEASGLSGRGTTESELSTALHQDGSGCGGGGGSSGGCQPPSDLSSSSSSLMKGMEGRVEAKNWEVGKGKTPAHPRDWWTNRGIGNSSSASLAPNWTEANQHEVSRIGRGDSTSGGFRGAERRGRGGKRRVQRRETEDSSVGCSSSASSSLLRSPPIFGFFTSPLRPSSRGRCKKNLSSLSSAAATSSSSIDASRKFSSSPSTSSSSLEVSGNSFVVRKSLAETRLHQATRLGCEDLVWHFLCIESVHANVQDNQGTTPLHICSSSGNIEIARLLLSYGAHPNAKALDGTRPLHNAVLGNHLALVRLLLTYGADPALANFDGKTPFHLAKSRKMRTFLKGFSSDTNGNDDTSWGFHESLHTECCSFLSNLPEDDDAVSGEICFDVLSSPPLSLYHVQPDSSSKLQLCHLLSDVCKAVGSTQKLCSRKLKVIERCRVAWDKNGDKKGNCQLKQAEPTMKYVTVDCHLKKLMRIESVKVSRVGDSSPRIEAQRKAVDVEESAKSEAQPASSSDNSDEIQKKKTKLNKKQDARVMESLSKLAKLCKNTSSLVERKGGAHPGEDQQGGESNPRPAEESRTTNKRSFDSTNCSEPLLLPVLDRHENTSREEKEEEEGEGEEEEGGAVEEKKTKSEEMEMPELTLYL